jgi:wobble nucleotide-excising tRNase
MIESIQIADIATYSSDPENLCDLSTFNFIFGANATGKTTIARIIANEADFPTCKLSWKGGTRLHPMVYNRDFIETNFTQCAELKGVFTLGEMNIETMNKIETAKGELDKITHRIEYLVQSFQGEDGKGGKKSELAALENEIKEKCWAQKQKYDSKFSGAFEGFRSSAEKYKSKILQELRSNSASAQSLDNLEKKAKTLFGQAPLTEKLVLRSLNSVIYN